MKLDSAFQHPVSGLLLALRSTAFVFTQVTMLLFQCMRRQKPPEGGREKKIKDNKIITNYWYKF